MDIKTKFNIDDKVWIMSENLPKRLTILIISIRILSGRDKDNGYPRVVETLYTLEGLDVLVTPNMIFNTKPGLMHSLFPKNNVCIGKNCTAIGGVGHSKDCIKEYDKITSGG